MSRAMVGVEGHVEHDLHTLSEAFHVDAARTVHQAILIGESREYTGATSLLYARMKVPEVRRIKPAGW